ncbi:hypothetical protein HZ994_03050 [Akkermansiaceae bacterium]|nr:hypothetical protein HZ994_03050 [Akkermansiaceae bacterium]
MKWKPNDTELSKQSKNNRAQKAQGAAGNPQALSGWMNPMRSVAAWKEGELVGGGEAVKS